MPLLRGAFHRRSGIDEVSERGTTSMETRSSPTRKEEDASSDSDESCANTVIEVTASPDKPRNEEGGEEMMMEEDTRTSEADPWAPGYGPQLGEAEGSEGDPHGTGSARVSPKE